MEITGRRISASSLCSWKVVPIHDNKNLRFIASQGKSNRALKGCSGKMVVPQNEYQILELEAYQQNIIKLLYCEDNGY